MKREKTEALGLNRPLLRSESREPSLPEAVSRELSLLIFK